MADLADLFRRLSAGVYVVGVAQGERRNAFTAAWVSQVSFDPLLLVLSVNPEHASYPLLVGGGGFSVNVLAKEQLPLARHFGTQSGREVDKLAGIPWRPGRTGSPILTEAAAYFERLLHRPLHRRRPRAGARPPRRRRHPPSRRHPTPLLRYRRPRWQPGAVSSVTLTTRMSS